MTLDKARQLAKANLDDLERRNPGMPLALIDEATIAFSSGWVFFFQSRLFVETGDEEYMLAGNAPILVDARDGAVHTTGTAYSPDIYIRNYEVCGDPHIAAVPTLVISRCRAGAQKVGATKLIKENTSLGLTRSKKCVDDADGNIATVIEFSDFDKAVALREELNAIGWEVRNEWRPPASTDLTA